jgi:cytochrome P450
LLQPYLSGIAVRQYEPGIGETVDGLLDPLLAAGGGDAVSCLCGPLPAIAVCRITGVPEADAPSIVAMVSRTALLLDGVTEDAGMSDAAVGALELASYGSDQLRMALAGSGNDSTLMRVLAAAVNDGTLTFEQAANILVQLFTAATTTSLIARSIETLATHAGLQQKLRDDPERIPGFLEEVLRHAGPLQFHYRWTPADTTLGATTIPEGSVVPLMWAAADRCTSGEKPTSTPFDLDNDGGPHLAFGRGLHFCIGAHLARLKARLATEADDLPFRPHPGPRVIGPRRGPYPAVWGVSAAATSTPASCSSLPTATCPGRVHHRPDQDLSNPKRPGGHA